MVDPASSSHRLDSYIPPIISVPSPEQPRFDRWSWPFSLEKESAVPKCSVRLASVAEDPGFPTSKSCLWSVLKQKEMHFKCFPSDIATTPKLQQKTPGENVCSATAQRAREPPTREASKLSSSRSRNCNRVLFRDCLDSPQFQRLQTYQLPNQQLKNIKNSPRSFSSKVSKSESLSPKLIRKSLICASKHWCTERWSCWKAMSASTNSTCAWPPRRLWWNVFDRWHYMPDIDAMATNTKSLNATNATNGRTMLPIQYPTFQVEPLTS